VHRVTRVAVLDDYRVDLTFADGYRGIVDLSDLVGRGVFARWNDYEDFRKVRIGNAGELIWPGDLDLCPDALYLKATGKKPEDVFPALRHELAHA